MTSKLSLYPVALLALGGAQMASAASNGVTGVGMS